MYTMYMYYQEFLHKFNHNYHFSSLRYWEGGGGGVEMS